MRKAEAWCAFFEDNHRYADLINGIGCGGVQFVKDTDLSEADSTVKQKSRDMLRRVAFGVNFAIVGIEHQEKNDYELPLRVMYYDATGYQKQATKISREVRDNPKCLEPGEYMYGFKKDSKLNPLVTFVLYAGEEEWDGPCNLHEMMDFTDVPDSLKDMVSDYKINVIDIRKFENTEVFQTEVKQVFDFIRCSNDMKKLLDLVENDVYYKEMDDDAFDVVTRYTNSKELVKVKDYSVEGGKNDVCKAIRDLMDVSREEGKEEAIAEKMYTTVINMLKENDPVDKICRVAECDEEYITKVREGLATMQN